MHDSSKQARSSLAVGQQELNTYETRLSSAWWKHNLKKIINKLSQIEASSAAHQIQAFSPF